MATTVSDMDTKGQDVILKIVCEVDGTTFSVPKSVLIGNHSIAHSYKGDKSKAPISYGSEMFANLLEDTHQDATTELKLPKVHGDDMKKIIEYQTYRQTNFVVFDSEDSIEKESNNQETELTKYDAKFMEEFKDQTHYFMKLFKFIMAVDFLGIERLRSLGIKLAADLVRKADQEGGVQKIRDTFGIKNDFTEEELEAVRKENEWCHD